MEKKSESSNGTRNSNILLLSSIVFFLIIVSLLGVGLNTYIRNSSPISQITVRGEARTKILPNKARLVLYSEHIGEDLGKVNEEADEVTNNLKKYFTEQGITGDDLKINKSAPYDYYEPMPIIENGQRVEVPKKRVEVVYELVVKDITNNRSKPNEIIQESINRGITRYGGITFDIDEIQPICDDLELKAIEDAYKKGEERIKALEGGTIVKRQVSPQIGSCGDSLDYIIFGRAEAVTSDSGSNQPIPPDVTISEQELTSIVEVTFDYI